MASTSNLDTVVSSQLTSLDDTDCYASAWADALAHGSCAWGGRGKGGRGLARKTVQPFDVIVENVRLEYVADTNLPGKVLLDNATLKLLSRRVYALVGRNGCGKSSLLRRVHAKKIPGFPTHISTFLIPQEVITPPDMTPMDVVLGHHDTYFQQSAVTTKMRIELLEEQMDKLDMGCDENTDMVEDLCQQISVLEEELEGGYDIEQVRKQAQEALTFFGVDESCWNTKSENLSGGQRKKVLLACALFCQYDLLLLDEPTNFLDLEGLLQLRRLISDCTDANRATTILLVSHDVDLINDVATDVIFFSNQCLSYYPGNYRDFIGYKNQKDLHKLRQDHALEKQREAMMKSIDNIKKQPAGKRGSSRRKKDRAIESRKKKLERHGIEKDEKGHRWSAQKAGSGIRPGSINSMDANTRSKLSHSQLLKRAEASVAPIPDKAVQFVFRDPTCTWGEPLIMLLDVGHGYGVGSSSQPNTPPTEPTHITKKDGMLFDCVDLCINEGSTTCIVGANGSGKSTLLRIISKKEEPLEGSVHHAHNISVGYFDQHAVDELIGEADDDSKAETALSLLAKHFPHKTEQDLRGELTNFGLSPKQASTNVRFLSGGERCRLCLASLMLRDPQILICDEPTSHLDIESVEALVYGLKHWKGTVVMVSHDANLIRSLGGTCFVIMDEEGKLRRIPDGIDSYLKAFAL